MLKESVRRALLGALAVALLALPVAAQKIPHMGRMWLFESPPLDWWAQEYGFEPTEEWLEHARKAALYFGGGCSASFVSPHGLIMTNHHCARDNIAEVSPPGTDYLKDGYFARSMEEELKVPGLKVKQLIEIKDVTDRVRKALDAAGKEKEAAAFAKIEEEIVREAQEEFEGLMPEIISLWQGGRYHLYLYKIFDDVRLVAAPHLQIASFGGDPDNFTYPRYCLDFTFCRAYEDGKPAQTKDFHFRFRTEGPKDGELTFVVGNPGSTGRLETISQMEYRRDFEYPRIMQRILAIQSQREAALEKAKAEGPDAVKKATTELLSIQNARKAYQGYLDGLKLDKVMEPKRKAEKELQALIEKDAGLKERYGSLLADMQASVTEKLELVRKIVATRPGEERQAMVARYEKLQEAEAAIGRKLGEAWFAVYGTAVPPDATSSLRISDGVIKGFPMNGTIAPWFSSLYGLYARHTEFGGKDPFHLPEIWERKEEDLDLSTPFNLVSTNDIIGGNSGSAMVDRELRVVGLIFDGNIESLSNRFVFMEDVPRSVSVHPAIIIHSLREVYESGPLADEVEGKSSGYLK